MGEEVVGDYWTIQRMARHLGAKEWNVRRVARTLDLGFVAGRTRVLSEADIPAMEIGLKMIRQVRRPVAIEG